MYLYHIKSSSIASENVGKYQLFVIDCYPSKLIE